MSYFKFQDDDIIFNTLKTHPECHFVLYQNISGETKLIYNNRKEILGAFADTYNQDLADDNFPKNVRHVPSGFVSLYEMNIDRPFNEDTSAPDTIYPFITKDGSMASFSTISTSDYNNDFAYGDQITGSYPLSASISVQRVPDGATATGQELDPASNQIHRLKRDALRTSFDFNTRMSKRFSYTNGLDFLGLSSPSWEQNSFQMIQIPSIFYGEKIKKGTVKLDWYTSGKLLGTLEDAKQNGELIVTSSNNSSIIGSFAGIVFYSEGFILLVDAGAGATIYDENSNPVQIGASDATWMDFMLDLDDYQEDVLTNDDGDPEPEAAVSNESGPNSFSLYFKGTHTIPTLTLLAEVERDECTHSNNPTFIDSDYNFKDVQVAALTSNNPVLDGARFQLSDGSTIDGRIGVDIPALVTNYTSTSPGAPAAFVNPFDGKDLYFRKVSETEFLVLYKNEAGVLQSVMMFAPDQDTGYQGARFSFMASGYSRQEVLEGSHGYVESNSLLIKNTVKSDYDDPYAEYEDHTYISKVAIYDDDKNLIGIAKLATPVKKTSKRDFTFKLKIDL